MTDITPRSLTFPACVYMIFSVSLALDPDCFHKRKPHQPIRLVTLTSSSSCFVFFSPFLVFIFCIFFSAIHKKILANLLHDSNYSHFCARLLTESCYFTVSSSPFSSVSPSLSLFLSVCLSSLLGCLSCFYSIFISSSPFFLIYSLMKPQ